MSSLQAPDYARAAKSAEAQMRRAQSFRESAQKERRRIRMLTLLERSRRAWIRQEFLRMEGPRAPVLRMLERAADAAHDRRLFVIEKMKALVRSARGAEMQARILYEESDGR